MFMQNKQLDLNTILYVEKFEGKCNECRNELLKINVDLRFEGVDILRWQKERIGYCNKCNKYYISSYKVTEFTRKYPGYVIYEEGKINPNKVSNLLCYVVSNKYKHLICKGKPKKNPFIFEKVILEDSKGFNHYREIRKCPECNCYFVNQAEAIELKKIVKKINVISAKVKETSLLKEYKYSNVDGKSTQLNFNSKLNVVDENKCLLDHDIINMNFKVGFMIDDKTRIIKEISGYYCNTCGMYIVDRDEYNNKSGGKIPNCNFYINYISSKKINKLEKVDFFVRTNIINCINKKHNVIDIIAEIYIVDTNGKVSKKMIPAYYCEECNLYFIYNNDYEKIRKNGIPLCRIYEYLKYIKGINNKFNLNQESLLRSFGYNVSIKDDLTEEQRRKILNFVIKNGIIDKHKVICLLNYLIDMKKNDSKYIIAINKWESDINYLNEINFEIKKHVDVNSIKIVKNNKFL